MQRHTSVLHWYTCKVVFGKLPHVCRWFLCSFYSLRCPGIRCKLSIKCSASRGGSLRQHGFLVLCSFDMTRRILFYSAFIVVVQFSSICTKVNQIHSCLLVLIVTGYVSCESVKIYFDKETAMKRRGCKIMIIVIRAERSALTAARVS